MAYLDLSVIDERLLKVVLRVDGGNTSHHALRTELVTAGEKAREALGQLVHASEAEIATKFTTLMLAGRNLRDALFHAPSDQITNAEQNRKQFELIENSSEYALQITFTSGKPLKLPWSVAYSGSLPPSGAELSPQNVSGFWCDKFLLTETYASAIRPDKDPLPREYTGMCAAAPMVDSAWTAPWIAASIAADELGFRRQLDTVRTLDLYCFLYFFGKADGEALALPPDKVPAGVIRDSLPRVLHQSGVAFLNLSSRSFIENEEWPHALSDVGFQGFIGIEVEVPDEFAWQFGVDFSRRLLTSTEYVADALAAVRREHWPRSLAYAAYCHPRVRFEEWSGLRASTAVQSQSTNPSLGSTNESL